MHSILSLWEAPSTRTAYKIAIGGDLLPPFDTGPLAVDWAAAAARLRLDEVDLSFVNLECTLECGNLPVRQKYGMGSAITAEAGVLQYLRALNCRVAGIANNHIFDFGHEGITRTRDVLAQHDIHPLGCQAHTTAKPEVFIWSPDDRVKVGFWASSNFGPSPTKQTVGIEEATEMRAREALAVLREGGAQCCIALLHAGLERTNRPDPADAARMQAFADAGFQVVAACHSHRISGYAEIPTSGSPAFCFYGLGSIASVVQYTPLESEGILAVIGVDADGRLSSVEARPVALQPDGWGSAATGKAADTILQRFTQLSEEIRTGDYQRQFYQEVSQSLVSSQLRDTLRAFQQGGFFGILQKMKRLRARHFVQLYKKVAMRFRPRSADHR
ncbi:MAG: CapA family protein [Armatimonadota bacterium]